MLCPIFCCPFCFSTNGKLFHLENYLYPIENYRFFFKKENTTIIQRKFWVFNKQRKKKPHLPYILLSADEISRKK